MSFGVTGDYFYSFWGSLILELIPFLLVEDEAIPNFKPP
jgi:hypothetical protein